MSKEQYWFTKFDEQKTSSLSCRQFCLEKEVSYQNFMRWRRKFIESIDSPFIHLQAITKLPFQCGKINIKVEADLVKIIAASHQANFLC